MVLVDTVNVSNVDSLKHKKNKLLCNAITCTDLQKQCYVQRSERRKWLNLNTDSLCFHHLMTEMIGKFATGSENFTQGLLIYA